MSEANRIDVHQHVVPPFWVSALAAHGGDPSGWYSPSWTPGSAIAFMDSQQIATGVLSLTAPGVMGWMGPERRDMARRVNEYTAGLVASQPSRFGNFATLPLPDVDGALIELKYALGALAADGIVLLSNYDGHYLGDPPSLLAFTHGQKVLFGSDYPYAPATLGAYFTSNLDGYADFTTQARASINNQTARSLFPRLRAMRNA